MPRVHHRTARKQWKDSFTGEVINKGDKYYTWSFRYGGTRRSIKPPKASQLTQSEYMIAAYDLEETHSNIDCENAPKDIEELRNALDDLRGQVESLVSEAESLRDETQEKLDNMPEQLQDGDVGQLLQQRVDALESFTGDLENIDFEDNIDEDDPEQMTKEHFAARIEEALSELQSVELEIE